MRLHQIETVQRLPVPVREAWSFFSDPSNLAAITPADMGFEVTRALPPRMHPGMIISYRVRPLLGIPVTWITEITHVVEPYLFVDEQRFGPYRFWHHQHHFREVEGGVEMRDLVSYVLPRGGGLAHPVLVRPRLEQIFAYRREVLERRYGTLP
jgi:ligand-binding SRPBCC domain-containing protein